LLAEKRAGREESEWQQGQVERTLPTGGGFFLSQKTDRQDVFLPPGLIPNSYPALQVGLLHNTLLLFVTHVNEAVVKTILNDCFLVCG
jgi:hypothetical protein